MIKVIELVMCVVVYRKKITSIATHCASCHCLVLGMILTLPFQ